MLEQPDPNVISLSLLKTSHAIITAADQLIVGADQGKCIYCGSENAAAEKMTKEHIIPLSIRGNIILPHASCKACMDKIRQYEPRVTNRYYGATRDLFSISSGRNRGKPRNKEYRSFDGLYDPETFGEKVLKQHQSHDLLLSSVLKAFILFEHFVGGLLPGILRGGVVSEDHPFGLGFCGKHDANVRSKFSVGSNILLSSMFRLMAKIAHGYTVHVLGLGGFRPILNEVVLDKSMPLSYFVGNTEPLPRENLLHRVSIEERYLPNLKEYRHIEKCYLVRVRLFACLETPEYIVVSGHPL